MTEFEENIKEVIFLSDLIRKQNFRACFIRHFAVRVKELENVSSKIDSKILQRLQLELLEPVMFHLNMTTRSDDKCELIQCIIQILKISLVHDVSEFFYVYANVFFQIYEGGKLPYQPSEELKKCVLECCSFLMKNSAQNVVKGIYAKEFAGKFSLGISVSVNIVKNEKNIQLRVAALDFLLAAGQFETSVKYTDDIFSQIGDLFMLYLPGILGPLLQVILRDEAQPHIITSKALSFWGHVLCLVMKDSTQHESLSDVEIMKQWLVSQSEAQEKIIDVKAALKEKKRTKLWLESAAITLHPLILKLSELRKHSHFKCRLELTKVMAKLLKNCIRNLKNCLPVILEVLVSSTEDENAEVCQVAKTVLTEFEVKCDQKNIGLFVTVIEENLFLVINKLPRVAQSGNEQLLLLSLKSLSGYIKILGRLNRLQHLISLSSTLKKLIFSIKVSFELETYEGVSDQYFSVWEPYMQLKCGTEKRTLVEDEKVLAFEVNNSFIITADDQQNSAGWCKPWKRFRYFADESIKTQLEDICQDLGNFGQPETVFDFILSSYDEDYSFRKENLLILNEVILGSKTVEDHTVNRLLDFYLDPENLYLPLQVNGFNCINVKEAQKNIIQVALIMEGIGKLAKRIENRFQDHLLKSLYYVLERMGSSYSVIREAATKSAVQIADSCKLNGSVRSLIQNNADYLTYHLTMKLKRNDGSVFDVTTVLMKNSSFDTLSSLEEIINSVLKSSSQNFDSPHTISYLRLFQTFVSCVRKWTKSNAETSQSNTPQENSDSERLNKYIESVTRKETEFDEEETGGEEGLQETYDDKHIEDEPKKPELSRHLKLILAVANHCLHYLSSKDKSKKILALEILNDCVWILADWEDDLLPLVHNIWSPLVGRFDLITDPLTINRSFTLLCTLSYTSRDFIRKRTLKDVLPALEFFLIKQAVKSKLKDSASGYFFTQNFKLQRELLGNLGKLTLSLGLFEKQSDLVVESALPYLSSLQPKQLQEKCRMFFTDLKAHDRFLIWYKVHNLVKNPEFGQNAEIVLNSIK